MPSEDQILVRVYTDGTIGDDGYFTQYRTPNSPDEAGKMVDVAGAVVADMAQMLGKTGYVCHTACVFRAIIHEAMHRLQQKDPVEYARLQEMADEDKRSKGAAEGAPPIGSRH